MVNLAKLRLDHAEAQKIVAEPFPQQEELDTKEQRLKVVTDELNQAAIEAKKNAPKREKTCYFERAKMKRDAARLGKKPKTPKDQTKGGAEASLFTLRSTLFFYFDSRLVQLISYNFQPLLLSIKLLLLGERLLLRSSALLRGQA